MQLNDNQSSESSKPFVFTLLKPPFLSEYIK
jgi:hypothetical protein